MPRPSRDEERTTRIAKTLAEMGLDAFVCSLRSNVLMLSGYWPVIGNAVAIATREGLIAVAAPQDEEDFASDSWADVVRTFKSGSLDTLRSTTETVSETLAGLKPKLGLNPGAKIGFEGGSSFDPSGYAATFSYGGDIKELLGTVFPSASVVNASQCLARLRSVLTQGELNTLRRACKLAQQAFSATSVAISAGTREFEIAASLRSNLASGAAKYERCGGFAYCMSGPNSAEAYAAFQQSRSRAIATGDFALLHCNSYLHGFWTDITRTFCIEPDSEKSAIIDAVLEASRQAIGIIRPGIKASLVDSAARDVLRERGFSKAFKHATGHGVGFAAINHDALPRIHPLSDEILEPGMVFNVEPAVYITDLGGMRHCDMVAVTDNGAEILTPFQNVAEELMLS